MSARTTTVRLEEGLLRRVRHRAVDEGCSMSALVGAALEGFLSGTGRRERTRRRRPGRPGAARGIEGTIGMLGADAGPTDLAENHDLYLYGRQA